MVIWPPGTGHFARARELPLYTLAAGQTADRRARRTQKLLSSNSTHPPA